jgi:hypothetical protein
VGNIVYAGESNNVSQGREILSAKRGDQLKAKGAEYCKMGEILSAKGGE